VVDAGQELIFRRV